MFEGFRIVLEYLESGGYVSIPLLAVFLVITYTTGYRLAVLFKGRSTHVRHLYQQGAQGGSTIQEQFLAQLQSLTELSRKQVEKHLEWMLLDHFQKIHKYSFVLSTAVLLAPLLGLLGTVMGMIETFASLADADLFSTTGGIAGGISQALVTTQFGLIIAIPGIFLSRFLKKIETKTYMDIVQMKELYLQEEGVKS